jgi:Tfp pilus assembly protein PilV
MAINKKQRPQGGFSTIEVLVAILVLALVSIMFYVVIEQGDYTYLSSMQSDGAIAIANQTLQQADLYGCGTAIGTEPTGATNPDSLANMENNCKWGYLYQNNASGWNQQLPSTAGPCSASETAYAPVGEVADSMWFCEQRNSIWYAIQLTTYWGSTNTPGSSESWCNFYTATIPNILVRQVTVDWWNGTTLETRSVTQAYPAPLNSITFNLSGTQSLVVTGANANYPIELTVNGYNIYRSAAPGTNTVWFPNLMPGTYTITNLADGVSSTTTLSTPASTYTGVCTAAP